MSDQLKLILYIKDMISDLIYLNSILASELIKITENLAAIRHGEEFLQKSNCLLEHQTLNQEIVEIVKKYNKEQTSMKRFNDLQRHILKHT